MLHPVLTKACWHLLRNIDALIRRELVRILNRTLAQTASERFPSASAFVQALAGATQNRADTLRLFSPTVAQTEELHSTEAAENGFVTTGFERNGFEKNGMYSGQAPLMLPQVQTAFARNGHAPPMVPGVTTALILHRPAPLALASSLPKLKSQLTMVQKREQRDLSWFAFGSGAILMTMLVLGVMNTTMHLSSVEMSSSALTPVPHSDRFIDLHGVNKCSGLVACLWHHQFCLSLPWIDSRRCTDGAAFSKGISARLCWP